MVLRVGEAGFWVKEPTITAYYAFTRWVINNLSSDDIRLIEYGPTASWPHQDESPDNIQQSLSAILASIACIDARDPTTQQCFLRLMRLYRTDRYRNMDYHIRYDVLACTVMIKRCMAANDCEELMNIYAMP